MEFETVSVALNMKMREHVMAFFLFILFFYFVNRYSGQWLNNIKCLYFKKNNKFLIINEKT